MLASTACLKVCISKTVGDMKKYFPLSHQSKILREEENTQWLNFSLQFWIVTCKHLKGILCFGHAEMETERQTEVTDHKTSEHSCPVQGRNSSPLPGPFV